MTEIIINSAQSLSEAIGTLRETWEKNKYVRMILRAKKRSLDQNSTIYLWYNQLAQELREYTALEYRCQCKLYHGVQILRAEDAEYRELYDKTIKRLTHDEKLDAMKFWPVTSLMTAAQLSQYMDAMVKDFDSDRRQHRVKLEVKQK